jgi:hypothetical protein
MSTATRSPETHELEGDDALNALRRTGRGRLAKDSFQRFRTAHSLPQLQSLPVARGSRIHSVGASVPGCAWCTSGVGHSGCDDQSQSGQNAERDAGPSSA